MSFLEQDTENRRIEKERAFEIKRGDNPSIYDASHIKTCFENDAVGDQND